MTNMDETTEAVSKSEYNASPLSNLRLCYAMIHNKSISFSPLVFLAFLCIIFNHLYFVYGHRLPFERIALMNK